jgi:TonB family protein
MNPSRLTVSSCALLAVLLPCSGGTQAADGGPDPSADPRFAPAAEQARREGEKVFKWILINGNQPKRPAQSSAAEPAAPAAKRSANAPTDKPPEPARATPSPERRARAATAAASASRGLSSEETATASVPWDPAPAAPAPVPVPESNAALQTPVEPPEDERLVLVSQVEPEFPVLVIKRLQKGSVLISFEVQVDGTVKDPAVVKSTHPRLNAAAVAAVAQWKFKPLSRAQSTSVELSFDIGQALRD